MRPITLLCLLAACALGCQRREDPPHEYLSWGTADEQPELTATMRNVIESKFWKTPQTEESIAKIVDYVHGLPSGSVLILSASGVPASFQSKAAETYRTPPERNVWRKEMPPGFGQVYTGPEPRFDTTRCIDFDLIHHPNLTRPQILKIVLMMLDSHCVDVLMHGHSADTGWANRYQASAKAFNNIPPRTDTDAKLTEFAPSLARLSNRTRLVLNESQVTDTGMKAVATVTHLTDLEIRSTAVTVNGLRELAPLTKLARLDWAYGGNINTRVTDEVLQVLRENNHLHALEGVAKHFDNKPKKRDSQGILTSASGERHPRSPEEVNSFRLGGSKVTDRGLKELAVLPNLFQLELYGTAVTDAGVKELASFPNLLVVELGGTNVTDAGLKELASFRQLISLGLSGTKVTKAGVNELQRALPDCAIFQP